MIIALNTNTMEVAEKAETKREEELIKKCHNLLYEDIVDKDKEDLLDLENRTIDILETAVIGTSHTFYKTPKARAEFIKMISCELLEYADELLKKSE